MFGELRAGVKNLLAQANTWFKTQTFRRDNLKTATTDAAILINSTAATSVNTIQVSPSITLQGSAWATQIPSSKTIAFTESVLPISSFSGSGVYKIQASLAGAALNDTLNIYSSDPSGNAGARLDVIGSALLQFSHSNFDPSTSSAFTLLNTSGQYSTTSYKFGSTIKAATTVDSGGNVFYRAVSSHNWLNGAIGPDGYSAYLTSQGLYVYQRGNFGGNLAAGNSDSSVTSTLSSGGSFAVKGHLVTASTYTIPASETVTYVDASNANICTGTPTHNCNFYTDSGTCASHSPCSWFSGTACSTYSGTDQTNCESGHSPCSWESASCSSANNTDSTICSNLNGSYGGSCSWDSSTCPGFSSDYASCTATTGCSWSASECSAFNFTDFSTCTSHSGCSWTGAPCESFNDTSETTCLTSHTGCTWGPGSFDCHSQDGTDEGTCTSNPGCAWNTGSSTCYGLCTGDYNEGGTCSGQYDTSCSGNLCTGTYYDGNCTGGSWGAACTGTILCTQYTSSTPCNAESGCSWSSGATITLPNSTSDANRSNIARFQYIKRIGVSGNVTVLANTDDTLESAITLTAQYQSVTLHHHNVISDCTDFSSEGACTPAGCTWVAAVVCADFVDQNNCVNNGCTWSTEFSTCSGAGTAAYCAGQYTSAKKWFKFATT